MCRFLVTGAVASRGRSKMLQFNQRLPTCWAQGGNMKHLMVLICSIILVSAACSSQARHRFAEGFAAGMQAQAGQAYAPPSTKLMIFGGKGHDVYLGCINCADTATDSVRNTYGSYGNSYSTTSIFNKYGDYGSSYSDFSPCNPYANNPPVIVDSSGNFYGYLTVNRYHEKVVNNSEIIAWLTAVCS